MKPSPSSARGCADLAVHHPARRHDVGAGARLGQRGLGVDLERGVVVDVAVDRRARRSGRGRCTRRCTGRRSARRRRRRRRAGRRGRAGRCRRGSKAPLPVGVLAPAHRTGRPPARRARPARRPPCAGSPGCAARPPGSDDDRLRLGDALAHEQRGDEVGRADGRLGDEVAQRRRAAQTTRPDDRERRAIDVIGLRGHSRGGDDRTSVVRVGDGATAATARPPRAAPGGDAGRSSRRAVTPQRRRTRDSASAAEPLASTTASTPPAHRSRRRSGGRSTVR